MQAKLKRQINDRRDLLLPNRRFAPRIRGPFTVRSKPSGSFVRGIELSFSGMTCATDSVIWPGIVMDFEVCLPGEAASIFVRGKVVELVEGCSQAVMRVCFDHPSADDRRRIALWMARNK